ncbi:MAG: flagellar hook-associated protein FlgK [Candidatus Calescibacterium sp.]|nr:flagellar hook-associated protein FlgK [Candidatus Calescibacterium sp.]
MAGIKDILFGAKNGMFASRSALQIVSTNIENAQTEGYTRQTPLLSPLPPSQVGVLFEGAKRERFFFLEKRMHAELQFLKSFQSQKEIISQVESLLSDSEGAGLLNAIDAFFNAYEELATNPENPSLRQNVVLKAQSMIARFKELANSIVKIREDIDKQISENITEVNNILTEIAGLNKKIAELSAAKENVNPLKDKRDLLIRKLSEFINIDTFEQDNGMINVYIREGGHVLVDKDRAFSLKVEADPQNPSNPIDGSGKLLQKIKYIDGRGHIWDITPFIIGGVIGGALKTRDETLVNVLAKINSLARQIIKIVGERHAKGVGIAHFQSLTSKYSASDSFTPINFAGLPYTASPGSLSIAIYDENGNLISTFTIFYDPSVDGIANIANFINSAPENSGYITAQITPDNKLKIQANSGFTFDIYNDTGGLSVALGLDTLLVGKNVFDFDVAQEFKENPLRVASSSNPSAPFNNDIANLIAALREEKINGSETIFDIYTRIQNEVGNNLSFINTEFSAKELVVKTLEEQIQQRSGVSLDEEFIRIIEFQRAFEASARIVRITDELLLTILGLVGGGG